MALTHPDSPLKEKMEYYIKPTEQGPKVQKQLDVSVSVALNPEELTFLDPACGSGHILVEAYDLFKEIYLERGYRSKDIPRIVLEKNLYGIDIDERAAQLSCFALLMKARQDDIRIMHRDKLKMNVIAMQSTKHLDAGRIAATLIQEKTHRLIETNELFPELKKQPILSVKKTPGITQDDISNLIALFKDAKTLGSLIRISKGLKNSLEQIKAFINEKNNKRNPLEKETARQLKPFILQTELLYKKYDCVVTNPPYMGGKGMNGRLKSYLKDNYAEVKSDLFSAFIVRNTEFALPKGQLGFMTPFVWMFISSYEKLRSFLIDQKTITSLVQLEYSGFDGATVPICTFTLENAHNPDFKGGYVRLSDFKGAAVQGPKCLEIIQAARRTGK